MRIPAVAAVLLALLVAGCGQASPSAPDFKGDEKAVADVVSDLRTAATRRKPDDICDKVVTAALKGKIAAGESDCAEEMKKAVEDSERYDLEVEDVTITGTTATATIRTAQRGKDLMSTFKLVKASGGWRIDSIGA
jgi:hypothetical protein